MTTARLRAEAGRALRRVGRWLRPLLDPDYEHDRRRLDEIAQRVRRHARLQERAWSEQRQALARVARELADHPTRADVRLLDRRVDHLRVAVGEQRRLTAKVLKQTGLADEHRLTEEWALKRLGRIATSNRPILVGPWSGEVGFELLYWIPFLRWASRKYRLDPQRFLVVSRGGPQSWYCQLGGRYLDILAHATPEEFRAGTVCTKKQRALGAFDRRIIREIARAVGVQRVDLLHPQLMYELFNPFYKQQATVRRIEAFTTYRAYSPADAPPPPVDLPSDYVAARFYFSDCFPDTPANRAFAADVLSTLARTTHVVLLNTGFHVDDHQDLGVGGDRIHTIAPHMAPETNLDVQTAVISRARAFVGTYGGYSYLAPLFGVDSLAFFSEQTFFLHHLELAQRVFKQLKVGSLVALDVRDALLVQLALHGRVGALARLATP